MSLLLFASHLQTRRTDKDEGAFLMSCYPLAYTLLWRRESNKETSTHPKAPPYMEGMQLITGRKRPPSRFWYGSRACAPLGFAMVSNSCASNTIII